MRYALPLLFALAACGNDGGIQPQVVPLLAIVGGDAQTDTIGKTLPVQIAAALVDKQSGAPLGGRIVNWVVVQGGGSVFAPVVQTGVDGIARQVWTLGLTPGSQKLVARWLDPDTGEPVTLDTATATAIGLPTIQLVNSGPDAFFAIVWQTGGEDTVLAKGYATSCAFVHHADSARFVALNGPYRPDSTPRGGGWIGPPPWRLNTSGPGNIGSWTQGGVVTPCTPS